MLQHMVADDPIEIVVVILHLKDVDSYHPGGVFMTCFKLIATHILREIRLEKPVHQCSFRRDMQNSDFLVSVKQTCDVSQVDQEKPFPVRRSAFVAAGCPQTAAYDMLFS